MKKAVSWLLIFVMAFCINAKGSFAQETSSGDTLKGLDYIVKRLSIFTKEDRRNLEIIFIPMLITDSGLDTLKQTVEEYTDESEIFMHVMLRKLLVRVDKVQLVKAISYLYMIDENVRQDYIGGYYERKELELTKAQSDAIQELFYSVFAKYPDLENVWAEDGITPGVAARFLQMFAKMNNDIPLFKENNSEKIEINVLTERLREKIEKALSESDLEFKTAGELLDFACTWFNKHYSGKTMKNFITAGSATGFIKAKTVLNPDKDNSGQNPGGKPDRDNPNTYTAEVVKNQDADLLIVSGKDSSGQPLKEGKYQPFYVKFVYDKAGYLISPDGSAVRLCANEGENWYAILQEVGTYKIVLSQKDYFIDVNGWGKDYINALYERKIINGRGNNLFCPDDKITREEFITLIVQMFGIDGEYENTFTDVDENAWYAKYVSSAKYHGLTDGYGDGRFGIGDNITRQDMCKILYSVIIKTGIDINESEITTQFYDRASIADYAYDAVMALKRGGIVSGDDKGCFNPKNNATRQEAATLIYNILLKYVKS